MKYHIGDKFCLYKRGKRQHFIILEKNVFQLSAWPAPLIKVKKEEKGFEKHSNNQQENRTPENNQLR